MSAGDMIPAGAAGIGVFVMLYTLLNAAAATVVACLHIRAGDNFGVITLASVVAVLNCVTSLIQQFHFMLRFHALKLEDLEVKRHPNQYLQFAYLGTSNMADTVLNRIRGSCLPIANTPTVDILQRITSIQF